MAINYEVEYDNRARVPEHPEIFARWSARRRPIARRRAAPSSASPTAPRRARPSTSSRPRRRTARAVHPWRLVALAASRPVSARWPGDRTRTACPSPSPATISARTCRSPPSSNRCARPAFFCGASRGSASWSTVIPPAGIWPPAWSRPTGRRSRPTRRPIWCPPATRSPACSIWRRSPRSPSTRISTSTRKSRAACSPLYWRVPAGRTLDAVVGALELSEFLRQSRTVAEAWRQGLAQTRYEADRRHQPFHRRRSAERPQQRDDHARRGTGASRSRRWL